MARAWKVISAAGFTLIAVTVGHWLAYLAAIPSASERAAFLHDTGHGYAGRLILTAAALMCAGFLFAVRDHLRGAASRGSWGFAPTWGAFVLAQVVVFIGIESVERVIAHGHGALFDRALLFGVAAQAVVAVVAVIAWRWLQRAAASVARTLGAAPVAPQLVRAPSLVIVTLRGRLLADVAWSRGPPGSIVPTI